MSSLTRFTNTIPVSIDIVSEFPVFLRPLKPLLHSKQEPHYHCIAYFLKRFTWFIPAKGKN